jgi:hypothetical protein
VSNPSFQQVEPIAGPPRGPGCGIILLLALGVPWLAFLGTASGLSAYAFAWGFGAPSIGVSIAAGCVAFVAACLATPIGMALGVLLLPDGGNPVGKNVSALLAFLLGPFVCYMELLVLTVPTGIAAGMILYWFQPVLGSILLAILAPLAGLAAGAVIFHHTQGDNDSGDGGGGDWGGDGGGGGDGGE